MPELVVAGTGHRPDKLGGYGDVARGRLERFAQVELRRLRPSRVVSGMAVGWDQALAQAALDLKIPFVAAIPFEDQWRPWPVAARERYFALLERADAVEYVCKPGYEVWKLHKRNHWMVDHCDLLHALFNGSPGGTASCITYARKVRRPIENAWDRWREYLDQGARPAQPRRSEVSDGPLLVSPRRARR